MQYLTGNYRHANETIRVSLTKRWGLRSWRGQWSRCATKRCDDVTSQEERCATIVDPRHYTFCCDRRSRLDRRVQRIERHGQRRIARHECWVDSDERDPTAIEWWVDRHALADLDGRTRAIPVEAALSAIASTVTRRPVIVTWRSGEREIRCVSVAGRFDARATLELRRRQDSTLPTLVLDTERHYWGGVDPEAMGLRSSLFFADSRVWLAVGAAFAAHESLGLPSVDRSRWLLVPGVQLFRARVFRASAWIPVLMIGVACVASWVVEGRLSRSERRLADTERRVERVTWQQQTIAPVADGMAR